MELQSVFKIEGKEVQKVNNFLEFEVYMHNELEDESTHFLVKKGKVLGKIVANGHGGAYNSASVDVTFFENS